MVRDIIDNKENIINTIKIQELVETIIIFTTLISRQSHPMVYVQSVELFVLFMNTFNEVQKDISLDFMLDKDVLSDFKISSELISHVKTSDEEYKKDQVSILNYMVKNLS